MEMEKQHHDKPRFRDGLPEWIVGVWQRLWNKDEDTGNNLDNE